MSELLRGRLHNAWTGRISGCLLGKPVEILSMREGPDALHEHLMEVGALPLRAYLGAAIPESGSLVDAVRAGRDHIPGDSECADAMRFGESEADFAAAIGDTVAAGWDTDCNGVTLAGVGESRLGDLVDRTVVVAEALEN